MPVSSPPLAAPPSLDAPSSSLPKRGQVLKAIQVVDQKGLLKQVSEIMIEKFGEFRETIKDDLRNELILEQQTSCFEMCNALKESLLTTIQPLFQSSAATPKAS